MRRARRLRSEWRGRDDGDEGEPSTPSPEASEHARTEALDANDRIRAEAPDDLETRRRADQIEREIRRAGKQQRPS